MKTEESRTLRSRVMPCILGVVLVLHLFLLHVALAGEVHPQWAFEPADLKLEKSGEFTQVHLKDCPPPVNQPGLPSLPAKYAYVVIPAGAKPTGIVATRSRETLVASNVFVYPIQPPRLTTEPPLQFVGPIPSIYCSATRFPEFAAVIQGEQILHGCKLVAVQLNPVSYVPAKRELFLATEITATLTYEVAPARSVASPRVITPAMKAEVAELVANPADVIGSSPVPLAGAKNELTDGQPEPSGTDAVYLLITSETLSNAFQPLVDRRTAQGKTGKLVCVEWITNNYSGLRPDGGTCVPTKIRNCIKDYYANHGTTWVCLAGDDNIIPLRYMTEATESRPSDMFYACLDGTYDEDADGIYGEALQDNADLLPEVWIGRIPVRTADQAVAYLEKLIRYETAARDGFANSMLIGSSFSWYMSGLNRPMGYSDHDPVDEGEWPMRNVYRNYIQPYWQATPLGELFNSFSTWDEQRCGDYKVTYQHMVDRLNQGYHHVYLYGHGNPGGGAGIDVTMASVLTNRTRPSIIFVTSCSTAAIDQAEPSLSEAMIRATNGGAIAYIGAARSEWNSTYTAEVFYTDVCKNKRVTLGEAFARSKMVFAALSETDGVHRGNEWILNLHGDPAIEFLGEAAGRALQVISPKGCEVIDQDADIQIHWNASGTNFAVGEKVRLDYSANGGVSWLPVPGAEERPFYSGTFLWENPGLVAGSQYRVRVTSVSEPAVSDASGRNFTIAPLKLLTVRSTASCPRFWIAGTHANRTDYTFTLIPGESVALTATFGDWQPVPSTTGYNFVGWTDANGNRLTYNTTIAFTTSGNKTIVAEYAPVGAPRDYYVNDETPENGFGQGNDENHDGTSLSDPVRHIQQIIDRYGDIQTVHVSAGIYPENVRIDSADQSVAIRGAGPGISILDGGVTNSCLILTSVNPGPIEIAGFTLRGGKASVGGGLYSVNSSARISNCEFTNNEATASGGAINAWAYSGKASFTISNCSFVNNRAGANGGGIYLADGDHFILGSGLLSNVANSDAGGLCAQRCSSVLVSNCVFEQNSAQGSAGGVIALNCPTGSISLKRNLFVSNRCEWFGGAVRIAYNGAIATLEGNTFERNRAGSNGGAVDSWNNRSMVVTSNYFVSNTSSGAGGAILSGTADSIQMVSNRFLSNTAAGNGGAVYLLSFLEVQAHSNDFLTNSCGVLGGGLAVENSSSASVAGNCFDSNTAHGNGGGINVWNAADGSLSFNSNVVKSNTADSLGGGVVISGISQLTATNNQLLDNHAKVDGGGVYLQGLSNATFVTNKVSGNRADRWSGGVFATSCRQMSLQRNVITKNTSSSDVAGVHLGDSEGLLSGNLLAGNVAAGVAGGVDLWNSTATVRDNLICHNSGSLGAGIAVRSQSQAAILNNTIVANTASSGGGGIYCENSDPWISNCIVWSNSTDQIRVASSAPIVSFCDMQGGWAGQGTNNYDIDPMFVDPTGRDHNPASWQDNDYHIRMDSPCKDAGDPIFVPSVNETDIDAEPRVFNNRVDLGADEAVARAPVIVTAGGAFVFTNGRFQFNVISQPGQCIVVEVSSDLRDWTPIRTNVFDLDPWLFVDETAGAPSRRFYRLKLGAFQ